jgi:uncharacterized membrane-anchored protein
VLLRKIVFVTVAALVLWYLGHFGWNALALAFLPALAAGTARVVDLVLLPLCVLVAWLVMRRLPVDGEARAGGR